MELVAATFETNRVGRLQLNKLDLGDLTKCEQSKLARMAHFFTFLAW